MIHQIVPTLHKELGGVDVAARELVLALAARGRECVVHSLTPPPDSFVSVETRISPVMKWTPARLGYSPDFYGTLVESIRPGDVIHNHSLWMLPNVYAGKAANRMGTPLLISPHGTLTPWSRRRSRFRKSLMAKLGQSKALETAHCLHVTAESELADIRAIGIRKPVAVIPNGIDIPSISSEFKEVENPRVLFLSRLHPKKGLDSLLRAWPEVTAKFPEAELVVAGPDESGFGAKMQMLANELNLKNVKFIGAIIGKEKHKLYAQCTVYVLPTHSENFGLTVGEALAVGTPVVTTTGAPWSGLIDHRCGWWIDLTESNLTSALLEALSLSQSERVSMGRRGREWMDADFSWTGISRAMNEVYLWLEGNSDRPDCVDI